MGQASATGTAFVTNYASGTVQAFTPADTDLALAQPANVTTDATSPNGAIAGYPLPAVTDEDSPALTASCGQASGSVFPIGDTTVTCNVTAATRGAAGAPDEG